MGAYPDDIHASDAIDKLRQFKTIMPVNELGDVLSKVKHKLELLLDEA